jgi:O-antigen biosynthesis protein WbqP
MKRLIDFLFAVILLLILAIPMILVAVLIKITSKGPVLYWSQRFGKNEALFMMPKFRTMKTNAPILATHLFINPEKYLFSFGSFLRKYSIDEFPQLFSILKGEMSFVGPRPALFSQDDLMLLRIKSGVASLCPGLTGWAQINGRDNLSIQEKVTFDLEYMKNQSFWLDFKILWMTLLKVFKRDGVSH